MAKLFLSISMMIPNLKSGDPTAWTRLVDEYHCGLLGKTRYLLLSSRLHSDFNAEDIVQETLLKAWAQCEKFRGETTAQFAAWLLAILKNTFVDVCRYSPIELAISTWFGFAVDGDTPSAKAMTNEREAELHACLAELEPKYRDVLVRRHFEGMKFFEIAQAYGENINTIVGRYRRGLRQLTDLIKQRTNKPLANL